MNLRNVTLQPWSSVPSNGRWYCYGAGQGVIWGAWFGFHGLPWLHLEAPRLGISETRAVVADRDAWREQVAEEIARMGGKIERMRT